MNMAVILLMASSIAAFAFGLIIGWMRFNVYRWIGIKRRISGKNYGIAIFKTKGKTLYDKIVNFDTHKIETNNGFYLIENNAVYRLIDGKKDESSKIMPSNIEYISGCPIIYFDIDDIKPLKFENDKKTEGTRNPLEIKSLIETEIAAAEAEAIHMTKSKIDQKLLLLIVISLACIVIGILTYINTTTILQNLKKVMP